MNITERILRRKIGAFELLVAAIVFELLFGSRSRLVIAIALCAGFYFAKRKFGGEFSLSEVGELLSKSI
jgi:hypothetical protein